MGLGFRRARRRYRREAAEAWGKNGAHCSPVGLAGVGVGHLFRWRGGRRGHGFAVIRSHHKPLIGGLAMLAALGAGIVGCAERERLVPQTAAPTDLFPCPNIYHHDGDAIRCGSHGRSMRLYAIDAPEMPGACRPGRQCTPGDPIAARDHLRALTAGKSVECRQLDTDRYGRQVVQCFASGIDLSCAMVRDGFAVERYGKLQCD